MHDITQFEIARRRWPRRSLIALIPAVMMACDEGEAADPYGTLDLELRTNELDLDNEIIAEQRSPGGGIWINNGLSLPWVGGVDPAFALSTPQGMSELDGVLTDPETQVAARYLVECALPSGASVTKQADGQSMVLEGRLGLAPQWELGDCDDDCQQWVSACMLARTNVSEQSIMLALRGEHPALGNKGVPGYDIYEASFFGNLFADPAAQYLCSGSSDALVQAHLTGRTCSSDAQSCGFEAHEDCWEQERCDFVWDDGLTAVDCTVPDDPTTYHTISVYILGSDDDQD